MRRPPSIGALSDVACSAEYQQYQDAAAEDEAEYEEEATAEVEEDA